MHYIASRMPKKPKQKTFLVSYSVTFRDPTSTNMGEVIHFARNAFVHASAEQDAPLLIANVASTVREIREVLHKPKKTRRKGAR